MNDVESGDSTHRRRLLQAVRRSTPIRWLEGDGAGELRGPLDWYYNGRWYFTVGLFTVVVPALGLQLIVTGTWVERLAGLVVAPFGVLLLVRTVQWLLRPVDPDAISALRAQSLKRRKPPRFPPGSPDSTRLPESPDHDNS